MLQLIAFELAILLGITASLSKDNDGLKVFAWIMTGIFIIWAVIQGNQAITNFMPPPSFRP